MALDVNSVLEADRTVALELFEGVVVSVIHMHRLAFVAHNLFLPLLQIQTKEYVLPRFVVLPHVEFVAGQPVPDDQVVVETAVLVVSHGVDECVVNIKPHASETRSRMAPVGSMKEILYLFSACLKRNPHFQFVLGFPLFRGDPFQS